LSNAELSKKVLTNMGILPTTDTSVAALEQALTDYFAAFGSKVSGTNGQVTADTRGFIVLQLASILSNSETSTGNLAVYNAAAVAWNSEVASAYTYSSNTASTTPTQSGSTGQSLTLTVNQDNITGGTGDDTINAPAMQNGATGLSNTLQGVDTIDGGTGNDTLNLTLASTTAATTTTPSMKNVENVAIRFTSGNDILGLGSAPGVTSITVANSGQVGAVDSIGDVNSLTVKNQTSGVYVTGTAGTATTMALNFDTVGTKTSTSVTATQLSLGSGAGNTSKVTTANVTTKDSYINVDSAINDVITTATVAATGTNTLLFSDSQATLTKVTVTGDGSVNLMGTPANPTAVSLAKVTTLDASAVKGAVTAQLSHQTAAITITTNAGDDYIKVDGVGSSGSTATLGAGNDTLVLGAKLTNFGKGVNGGEGTDVINITTGLTASADAKTITNFETLDISGAGIPAGGGLYVPTTYDVSLNNFPTVQIDEAIAGSLFANTALTNAPDTFGFTIASKKQASGGGTTSFDTVGAIAVNGKDHAGTTLNGDAETFNLIAKLVDGNKDGLIQGNIINNGGVTVGTNNAAAFVENISITATATVDGGTTATSNVTSNYVFTPKITTFGTETITIKGDATVDFSTVVSNFGTAVTKVDASASTGNIVNTTAYSTGASIIYLGSAGTDIYKASGKGDSIFAGKGGDLIGLAAVSDGRDTLIYKAATDSQLTDVSKDGKITLALDASVYGTIAGGLYITLPTATMDTIASFGTAGTVVVGPTAASDRIDLTNFGFTGAQRGVENVTAKVSATTDLTSITGLFSSAAGSRGVAFTTATGGGGAGTTLFVDANKDGNFTAADDLVILIGTAVNFSENDVNF
jgi:hypothetical protein